MSSRKRTRSGKAPSSDSPTSRKRASAKAKEAEMAMEISSSDDEPQFPFGNVQPTKEELPAIYPPRPKTPPPLDPEAFIPNYFRNNETRGKWADYFNNRPLGFCETVDINFLKSMKLPCYEFIESSGLSSLFDLQPIALPRLVRLFYINMSNSRNRGNISISSVIDGHPVSLDYEMINHLLQIPPVDTSNYPSRAECAAMARERYVVVPSTSKQITQSQLSLEAKLVHSLITRTLLPKTTSRELVTEQTLEILFLILHGLRIDIPTIIINQMIHIQNSKRPGSLPYANLLSYIFKWHYFDLSSDDQETGMGIFDEKSVSKLGIVKNVKNGEETWELKALKDQTARLTDTPSSSTTSNLSSLETRLEDLELGLDSVRCDLIDFKGSLSDYLDKNYEMMAVVNAKVNQLFSLCSLNFQATSNIMPLEEEVAKHTREEAQQVLLECERRVRKRPLLRPYRYEPNIVTVEQYGVIKRYRDDERIKLGFMKREDKIVVEARERCQAKRKISLEELGADWKEEDGLP